MTSAETHFNVAIIGGGPAGSAAAITLARAGRRALLIEKSDRETFKVGETLPPAITPLLAQLGVLDRFKADRHLISHGNKSAWGSASLESADYGKDPNGHGWHIDRPRFDAMLRDAAREYGAHVLEATRVGECKRTLAGDWRLELSASEQSSNARASWVIDCTGRRSWLARQEGVRRRARDKLLAFVSLFQAADALHETDSDSATLVESVEEGWWYTALVPGGRRVVVYLTDSGTRSASSAREAQGYRALIKTTVHIHSCLELHDHRLGLGPLVTSSGSSRLVRVAGAGWLAAGDAAAAFDPISSQGILTAMYSGLKAGRAIDAHLSGNFEAVRDYELRIVGGYDAYLDNLAEAYRYEQRWPESTFWRARQAREAARTP